MYEKHCSNPYFQFVPSITDSKSTVFNSSSFRSSSSFSAQSTISSFSSISASTADYANTEDEELTDLASLASTASDFPDDDTDFVDEFFLFPYTVLDADFDTICSELSRYSPDIERLHSHTDKMGHLKAAKASDEWNTLWIYRGV